jgi:hypothetical protein
MDNRNASPSEAVEKSGFADIRSADDCDMAHGFI